MSALRWTYERATNQAIASLRRAARAVDDPRERFELLAALAGVERHLAQERTEAIRLGVAS